MILTGLSRVKVRGVFDFYGFYPFRKNIPCKEGTIPQPYVKLSEVSDNKMALDFNEYNEILECIFKKIQERLVEGEEWHLNRYLGYIQLKKIKVKKILDLVKSKESGKRIYRLKNDHDNYMIMAQWFRRHSHFKNRWLWRFIPVKEMLKEVYKRNLEDYTYITRKINDK